MSPPSLSFFFVFSYKFNGHRSNELMFIYKLFMASAKLQKRERKTQRFRINTSNAIEISWARIESWLRFFFWRKNKFECKQNEKKTIKRECISVKVPLAHPLNALTYVRIKVVTRKLHRSNFFFRFLSPASFDHWVMRAHSINVIPHSSFPSTRKPIWIFFFLNSAKFAAITF